MEADAEISTMPALATVVLSAGTAAIAEAAAALAAGRLVAFPTETVYGLGADATDDAAVARLYAAKERPSFNPLIAHVAGNHVAGNHAAGSHVAGSHVAGAPVAGGAASAAAAGESEAAIAAACRLAHFDASALRLAAAFWPGPLTLVLPKVPGCPVGELATAGLDTIAVRAPSHPVARAILSAFAKPVVAPSANRSGRVSPTSAQHVLDDLAGRIDLIIDGGAAAMGVESTVLACRGGEVALLRPGAIPRAAVEQILGRAVAVAATAHDLGAGEGTHGTAARPLAPGMLASHYAPRAAVRLNAVAVAPGEALLAFGPVLPPGAGRASAVLNLSGRGDLVEAAANLFGHLRLLDGAETSSIAVMPVPDDGLGEAINDRLRHAAAPRPAPSQPCGGGQRGVTAGGDSDIFHAGITS
jgi:L-threonylcarbamoyladenylate synthase